MLPNSADSKIYGTPPSVRPNKAYKDWPAIFGGNSTLTSAVLDRLLHHCETVLIKGSSYRMRKTKEQP